MITSAKSTAASDVTQILDLLTTLLLSPEPHPRQDIDTPRLRECRVSTGSSITIRLFVKAPLP
jgi:hypothetical protein